MTTEDDFQAALDAHPDDWQTRVVFADWLDERGDPRGPGYRALGGLQKYANLYSHTHSDYPWFKGRGDFNGLPDDWFDLLEGGVQMRGGRRIADLETDAGKWLDWFSRSTAEDAAALAFARLPPARQLELLAGTEARV